MYSKKVHYTKFRLIILLIFFINTYSSKVVGVNDILKNNESYLLKCIEKTGTGREDFFKIGDPSFQWKYKNKWYELANSNKGISKDWNVVFLKNKIKLYNKITKWQRVINLKNMSAVMEFSTGEKYLYDCSYIKK